MSKVLMTAVLSVVPSPETAYRAYDVSLQLNGADVAVVHVRIRPDGFVDYPKGLDDLRRVFGYCPAAQRAAASYAYLAARGEQLTFPIELGNLGR